jgi:hypothetical protein
VLLSDVRIGVPNLSKPEMSNRASVLLMHKSAGACVPSHGNAALPAIVVAKLDGDTSLPNRGRLHRQTTRCWLGSNPLQHCGQVDYMQLTILEIT